MHTASFGTPTYSSNTRTVTDDLGPMTNEATGWVKIVVQVNAAAGTTLTNTGYVSVNSATDTDTNLANNQYTVHTVIAGLPSKRDLIFR